MNLTHLWIELLRNILSISLGNLILIAVGTALIVVGMSTRRYIPILVPIGFGLILANFGAFDPNGTLGFLYTYGINNNLFVFLTLFGLGSLVDFGPLLARPRLLVASLPMLVAVIASLILAGALFPIRSAAAIALISTFNGPGAVFAANALSPELVGPVGLAALLWPLIGLWALTLFANRPLISNPETPDADPLDAPGVDPNHRLVFGFVIVFAIGLFFNPAVLPAAALTLGYFFQPQSRPFIRQSFWGRTLTIVGLFFTSLLIGSSLNAGAVFSVQALLVLLVGLFGLVIALAGSWLLYRWARQANPQQFAPEKREELVMGVISSVLLVGFLLTGILVTIARLIAVG